MGGFIKQALIGNLLCILIFPYQNLSNLCVLQALDLYIWKILLFSLQKLAFGYLAKGICEILLISPQNLYILCQMYFYFVLCLCFCQNIA